MKESNMEEGWLSARLHRPGLCALTAFTLMLGSQLTGRKFMGPIQMALLTLSFLIWLLALLGFSFLAQQAYKCGETQAFRRMLCLALCIALVLFGQGMLARSRLQKGTVADFLDAEYGRRELCSLSVHIDAVRPELDLTSAQQKTFTSALLALPYRTWGPEAKDISEIDVLARYEGNPYDNENPGAYVQVEYSWSLHWMDGGIFSLYDRHTERRWTVVVDADWEVLLADILQNP